MVDNAAGDDVEPKPTKNEASGDASGEGSDDVKGVGYTSHLRQGRNRILKASAQGNVIVCLG